MLLFAVPLHALHDFRRTSGALEIVQCLAIHREETHGGPILRRHVRDRRPIGQPQGLESVAKELHEPSHHAVLAQHLGHDQYEIGGRGALRQAAGELHPHHLGQLHEIRLPQHHRLGLDAAHAPTHHAHAVDHRGVGVGAHQRIRICHRLAVTPLQQNDTGEVLQVHLVDDAGAGRNDGEIVECLLRPPQQSVALGVAFHLPLDVQLERPGCAKEIHLDRVIDDEIGLNEWVDLVGVTTHPNHGIAHCRKIHHRRHSGEVLEYDAPRHVRHFATAVGLRFPAAHQGYLVIRDDAVAVVPQHVFQQNANRVRQHVQVGDAGFGECIQAVYGRRTCGEVEGVARIEWVCHAFYFVVQLKFAQRVVSGK